MYKNEPIILLSICIPTYNRAEVLKSVIELIVSDPDFDEEVELVISDNCSSDNTGSVVSEFTSKFSNVRYYCNETNIRDENFTKVLSYGQGLYLKLLNDYVAFAPRGLLFIKNKIKENILEKYPIFFTGDSIYTNKKSNEIFCNSLDEYIQSVSTSVTWIGNFGAWKIDFEALNDKNRYKDLLLLQVDWTYQLVDKKGGAIIYDNSIYIFMIKTLGVRRGYNWFKVHIDNYYLIMNPYVASGIITQLTYLKDRIYTLKHFRRELINIYVFNFDRNFQFETLGTFDVLWKYYKKVYLFYWYLVLLLFGWIFYPLWLLLNIPFIKLLVKQLYNKIKK